MAVRDGQGDPDLERTVLDTRPCFVRYSLRGLGTFSGGLCLIFGVLNMIFHPINFVCLAFSIIQTIIGFFVATNEATGGNVRICYCIFVNKLPSCTEWMEGQALWVKPFCYILAPLFGMIFCTTWWTFFGGGMVVLTGFAYGISLWKHNASNNASNSPQTSNNNEDNNANNTGIHNPQNKVFHSQNNEASSSNPTRPTVIDIRKNTNGSGLKSPTTPLSSLSNYDKHKVTNLDNDSRYENIPTIAGSMEMTSQRQQSNLHSYYSNVDLENNNGGAYGGSPYPDNPFVINSTKPNTSAANKWNGDDEFNC